MSEQEAKEIVLEWWKDNSPNEPRMLLFELMRRDTIAPKSVTQAYDSLEVRGQFELLAEFADWGLKEGAKG
ncbi:hypothetical protein DXQ21_00200 [Listeria monocytogenes]|nr:hypothetical protein [Listeria monocytogenes]